MINQWISIFTSEKDFDLKFLNNSDNPGWNYSDENYSTDARIGGKMIKNAVNFHIRK